MTQPEYVPISSGDRVRGAERLPVPRPWRATRSAETDGGPLPAGRRLGSMGPDQGYALRLARRFEDRLLLAPGEHTPDTVAGCMGVSTRRAALFGRAPISGDLELAFAVWGFLGEAPSDLVDFRRPLFAEASHHYWVCRDIADRVPQTTLRLTPAAVRERLNDWRSLIVV